ncbi:MAG: sodium:solute symporter [Fidelibacterota bacterium]
MNLTPLDGLALFLYLAILLWLGFRRSHRSEKSDTDYILAGRRLSLPGFVMTLVSTWYGGILGVGENTFRYGLQTWVIFGLPYYLFALLFALFLAPRIRSARLISIPDHFAKKYDNGSAVIAAVFILFIASPAPYILSIGVLVQSITGMESGLALILATGTSLAYIWYGGFRSVVRTDIFQFILMYIGFILIIAFAWQKAGSPLAVWDALPVTHRQPTGGNSISYILVWFFIALWTFIDPGFYQRSAAARSGKTAARGIIIAIGFWFLFDMLTLFAGFYARVILPDATPLFAFPALGQAILPPFIYGLFLAGLLATIMSTIDSLGLLSAVTFGRDILWRIRKAVPKLSNLSSVDMTRQGLAVMALLSVILAASIPSVVGLWYTIGSLIIPGLLLPFIMTFTSCSVSPFQARLLLILPVVSASAWWLLSIWIGPPFAALEPFYCGLAVSVATFIMIRYSSSGN